MKLPRDVGGRDLADLLSKYGYQVTRQTGSHLRLARGARVRSCNPASERARSERAACHNRRTGRGHGQCTGS
jgi:hypothetical protein